MTQSYNDPINNAPSSIGSQLRTDKYNKKALIEARKEQYFSQMSSTENMPKNMGKTIKRFHYLPLLDDANINDQGIDADGLSSTVEKTIIINKPDVGAGANAYVSYYAVGEGANAGAATTAAEAKAVSIFKNLGVFDTNYTTTVAALLALAEAWVVDATSTVVPESGNLYGSSKDVGTIAGKLPTLTENGGRVNRVGFKRIELEGSISKLGFFDEYTQESMDFDSDEQREEHITREMVVAANEMTEDALQIDLLNAAGVVRYGGTATSTVEISGETGGVSLLTYDDFMRLSIDLDNNRSPKNTKIITGTRMVDTRVINGARYMFVGTEMVPSLKRMVDNFGNQAFISVEKYAAAGTIATGEIGTIDQFRIVVVPEMMHWEAAGADVTTNDGYRETGGKYDVFPLLVIGSEAFVTIGFQTDGKSVKFKITHKKPGDGVADRNDPYGETGFMSIKWYYGTMILRPERIALMKTVAEY
jgi:N4-gp56 family major capsid protein|tara:strand:- start:3858 stop:5282 length:1425 start_codon:yes stop_codon:yes gene_type:complete